MTFWMMRSALSLCLWAILTSPAVAWAPPSRWLPERPTETLASSFQADPTSSSSSRRQWMQRVAGGLWGSALVVLAPPPPPFSFLEETTSSSSSSSWTAHAAAATAPTPEELLRLQVGYQQITYLLDHFDQETTVCRDNGGQCKRDADPIRRALGLRSTTDPLFQIEKVLAKVKNMQDDTMDMDQLEAFFEAAEDFNAAINMSNSMAFISQFGEYNPGGGQDEVLKYLNESKKQVVLAQKALKTILECLGLPVRTA